MIVLVDASLKTGSSVSAEALIVDLAGRPGFDVRWIDLGNAADDSQRMMIQRLSVSCVCVTAHDPSTAADRLETAGCPLPRRPHRHDVDAAPTPPNSPGLYLYDAREFADPDRLAADLMRLRQSSQTQVVSLAGGLPPMTIRAPSASSSAAPIPPSSLGPTDARQHPDPLPSPKADPVSGTAFDDRSVVDPLDDWIDELDRF